MTRRLAIVKTGEPAPEVFSAFGSFESMFERALAPFPLELELARAEAGERPSAGVDAVIITGSPSSVTARAEWVESLAEWLGRAASRGVPILGVCYGHQLLAYAFGGVVEKNVRGYELGTIEVRLSAEGALDPLFRDLSELRFHAVHEDAVSRLPERARLLAENDDAMQSFAIGDHVRAVQFHPEFSADVVRVYSSVKEEALRIDALARGRDPEARVREVRETIREAPAGLQLLRNFVERFVLHT